MTKLYKTTRDIFGIPELRSRIFYTVVFIAVYVLGTYVLLPGLDQEVIKKLAQSKNKIGFMGALQRLTGSSFSTCSFFSLGVAPYVSASIAIQVGTLLFPYLQRMQKEGASGRQKITQITRYLTLVIAVGHGLSILNAFKQGMPSHQLYSVWTLVYLLLMIAGAMACVYIGERITEKGLGNGISVLIMVGIIKTLPKALGDEVDRLVVTPASRNLIFFIGEMVVLFAIIIGIIAFIQANRKILLEYARQMVGRGNSYGQGQGVRQYLPLKVNASGVMPVIFAQMIVLFVCSGARLISSKMNAESTNGFVHAIYRFLNNMGEVANAIAQNNASWRVHLIKGCLIFLGSFMYASAFINPMEIANDLKRNNGYIAGVQAGRPTADYIDRVVSWITGPAAIVLVLFALLPPIVSSPTIGISREFSMFFGGTSMLITIGVVIEMIQQIQGHLAMLYYDKMASSGLKVPKFL